MSLWTPERVEQLKKLRLEGLSAQKIADILGSDITRSAVLGKIGRLGLSSAGRKRVNYNIGPARRARLNGKKKFKPVAAADEQAVSKIIHLSTLRSRESPERPPRGFQEIGRYGQKDLEGTGEKPFPQKPTSAVGGDAKKVPHHQWCHYSDPITGVRCNNARVIHDGKEQAYCEKHLNHQPSTLNGISSLERSAASMGSKSIPHFS